MPWGWECRKKLIKQVPTKPVDRRAKPRLPNPAPNEYEQPQIFCGPGFDRIKKAPAYTFGLKTKTTMEKPLLTKNARMFNIQGTTVKGGRTRITHCVVTPHIEPVVEGTKTPGPAVYKPPPDSRVRRSQAYSIQPPAKPPFQPDDMWTPPSNMYHPPILTKAEPAYTLGNPVRELRPPLIPGPGEHDPKFNYVKKTKPAYSFGPPFRTLKPQQRPAPNTYCEKKFMYPLRTNPAPSFGIRHSPYIGVKEPCLKSSKLDLAIANQ